MDMEPCLVGVWICGVSKHGCNHAETYAYVCAPASGPRHLRRACSVIRCVSYCQPPVRPHQPRITRSRHGYRQNRVSGKTDRTLIGHGYVIPDSERLAPGMDMERSVNRPLPNVPDRLWGIHVHVYPWAHEFRIHLRTDLVEDSHRLGFRYRAAKRTHT